MSLSAASAARTGWPLITLLLLTLLAGVARGDDPPADVMAESSTHPFYFFQEDDFAARFWVFDPNRDQWVQGRVSWSTNETLLFYAFNRRDPQGLIKVIDGRGFNGHWWGDFAALSDLRVYVRVWNMETLEHWNVESGRHRDLFRDSTDPRRMVCVQPGYKDREVVGYQCVWGAGISSREAWRLDDRIPAEFWIQRTVGYLE